MIGKILRRGASAARTAARVGKGMLTGPDGPGHGVAEYEDFERIRAEAAAQDLAEGNVAAGSDMEAIAEGTVEMSAEDLRVMMEIEEDETLPIIVDVRHDSDWQEGHIEGALHIPISKLAGRLAEINQERLVVLY
ncbi:MAG: rhodanese-like domain-containing protein, partial [Myxococcota bacterium]|nr:rhodanese-like domain-containing protein [Myxococcota bacterium]